MSNTLTYLKYLVIVPLAILMVLSLLCGAVFVGVGVFASVQEMNAAYLILIPSGLFLGLTGFVSMDCLKYLVDKWGLSK